MFRSMFRLILIIGLLGSGLPAMDVFAQGRSHELQILLLVDDSYFISEPEGCRFDIERQKKVFLKFLNEDGRQRGSLGLVRGEVIEREGSDGEIAEFCAYARRATVTTSDEVVLELHGIALTTISPTAFGGDQYLLMEIGSGGLVFEDVIGTEEVETLGIEMPVTAAGATRTTRAAESSRPSNSRSSSTTNSSETGTGPTATNRSSRSSSGSTTSNTGTTPTRSQSGIIIGEWELEGPEYWDYFYVSIEKDYTGYGPEIVAEVEPIELAVEMGLPLVGEGRAPSGCRLFAFSGPLGVGMYIGMCADGEHVFYGGTTDKAALDDAMDDFSDGRPFRIPRGYWAS